MFFGATWAQSYDQLFEWGAQSLKNKEYAQAISHLRQAIALEPDNKLNE